MSTRDGARKAFLLVEQIAEIPHVECRCWYGLRWAATDLAETETTDDRVKEQIGGHNSEMRVKICQDRKTEASCIEAACDAGFDSGQEQQPNRSTRRNPYIAPI